MTVMTYGVFDLPHYGHLRVLKRAKRLGDELIIGVFSDKVAKSFKRKPVMTQIERIKFIKELNLGWVVLLEELKPTEQFLTENLVRVVAKAEGAGWSDKEVPKWDGVRSVLLPYSKGVSTSEIIKRIKCL